MPLEILHFPLVLFGCGTGFERAQVAPSTGAGVLLSRVKPIFAGGKFANHADLLTHSVYAIRAPELSQTAAVNGPGHLSGLNQRRSFCIAILTFAYKGLTYKCGKLARPRAGYAETALNSSGANDEKNETNGHKEISKSA